MKFNGIIVIFPFLVTNFELMELYINLLPLRGLGGETAIEKTL